MGSIRDDSVDGNHETTTVATHGGGGGGATARNASLTAADRASLDVRQSPRQVILPEANHPIAVVVVASSADVQNQPTADDRKQFTAEAGSRGDRTPQKRDEVGAAPVKSSVAALRRQFESASKQQQSPPTPPSTSTTPTGSGEGTASVSGSSAPIPPPRRASRRGPPPPPRHRRPPRKSHKSTAIVSTIAPVHTTGSDVIAIATESDNSVSRSKSFATAAPTVGNKVIDAASETQTAGPRPSQPEIETDDVNSLDYDVNSWYTARGGSLGRNCRYGSILKKSSTCRRVCSNDVDDVTSARTPPGGGGARATDSQRRASNGNQRRVLFKSNVSVYQFESEADGAFPAGDGTSGFGTVSDARLPDFHGRTNTLGHGSISGYATIGRSTMSGPRVPAEFGSSSVYGTSGLGAGGGLLRRERLNGDARLRVTSSSVNAVKSRIRPGRPPSSAIAAGSGNGGSGNSLTVTSADSAGGPIQRSCSTGDLTRGGPSGYKARSGTVKLPPVDVAAAAGGGGSTSSLGSPRSVGGVTSLPSVQLISERQRGSGPTSGSAESVVVGSMKVYVKDSSHHQLVITIQLPADRQATYNADSIVVKANRVGNRLRVVSEQRVLPQQQLNELLTLPVVIDPYHVSARLERQDVLVIEAPIVQR